MKNLKVSSLFHWLYGAVMFLPILLLPVFMIYSHRHSIDSGTIEVPQNVVIDFNQVLDVEGNDISFNPVEYADNKGFYDLITFNYNQDLTHKYIFKGYFDNMSSNIDQLSIAYQTLGGSFSNFASPYIMELDSDTSTEYKFLRIYTSDLSQGHIEYYNFQLFDLTQMFGAGNEPTLNQFNQWFTEPYYDYVLSRKELLQVGFITYDDTDIMSQATYQLYNATDKYFNIGQFFGFENLWDYMVLNWFGGNVTIYLRIFWQLLTYWLVVSIAWLIFDLFMYVPKLAHRWLDRSAIE